MRYSIIGATVDQVKSAGGTDIKEARSTGIIFATLTEEQAAKLKTMGCQVTPVGDIKVAITPPVLPPTPVAAVPIYSPKQLSFSAGYEELRKLISPPLQGSGLYLVIIGSGIRETHEQIGGRVVYRKNYTSSPMEDTFDHDTGVCSIALAVAPLCNVLNLKVLNDKGSGTEEEVVLAIDDCIAMRDEGSSYAPHVINLSLGSTDDGNPNNPMRVASRAAIERGIWIVAAAGNSGPSPGTILSPACEKYVFSVGSIDPIVSGERIVSFMVSEFSSRGPSKEGLAKPDGVFFGKDILMASSSSDTATTAKSGTSFSCPFVAGAVVLFLEGWLARFTNWQQYVEKFMPQIIPSEYTSVLPTEEDVLDKYLQYITVKPQGAPQQKDNDYGWGLPYGPLVLEGFRVSAAIDISSMMVPMFAMMMMVGMVMPLALKKQ